MGFRSRFGVWDGLSTIKLASDIPPLVFLYKVIEMITVIAYINESYRFESVN